MDFRLETLLDAATDGKKAETDWTAVKTFCSYIRRDEDRTGPGGAIQMILDKVRSPNITVAGHGLTLLEACVKNCGPPVHAIIGKFRFLNELIKLVSPKYHSTTSDEIKDRILVLILQWNFSLPNQGKIKDVFQMLKKQGVKFPENPETVSTNVPAGDGFLEVPIMDGERRSPLEEQDKRKAKLLEKLLKSKDPNDLVKANRLIKKMVQQDQKKSERNVKLKEDMELVHNNTSLFTDLLNNFDPATDGRLEQSDLIQEMHNGCMEMRRKLFKLASDLGESDEMLGEVLAANDELTRVLDLYQAKLNSQGPTPQGGAPAQPANPAPAATSASDDLMMLNFGGPPAQPAAPVSAPLSFGLAAPPAATPTLPTTSAPVAAASTNLLDLDFSGKPAGGVPTLEQQFGGLDLLGGPSQPIAPVAAAPQPAADPLGDLLGLGSPAAPTPAPAPAAVGPPPDLSTVTVALDAIQPGTAAPVNAYDKNGLRVMFHFAQNSPHPSILVVVVSFLNFLPTPISGLMFQAAVPKQLVVKLQPASGTQISPNNPATGASVVTQVMLVSNPNKVPVRVRFKLNYSANGQQYDEMGDCSSFPAP